jgi:type II secretory pathway component PulC
VIAIVVRLVVITLLVCAGVFLWYGGLEKHLQEKAPVDHKAPVAAPSQPATEETSTAPAAADYQVILTRNIFKASLDGDGSGAGAESQGALDDLSETKLHLALLGTVTGSKDDARAIIRDEKSQLEDLYMVGSEIQGAIIARISRGKVVLQVNGREEVLNIKDPQADGARQDRPQQDRPAKAAELGVEVAPSPPPPDKTVEQQAPEAVPRRRISFRSSNPPPPSVSGEEKTEPEPTNIRADAPPVADDENIPQQTGEAEHGGEAQPQ